METTESITSWLKERAKEHGFEGCGISRANVLEEERERMEEWLKAGMHGEMGYMERNMEMRLDPRLILDNAKSVISFLYNYYPREPIPAENNYVLSKYTYGRDYHQVIREKLYRLIAELKARAGDLNARAFTDSAPVLERAWAQKCGLGWTGKNTCLIHPKLGSFFFLAEIITDLELEPDTRSINDLCGGCTRCIDACPTGAIVAPRVLDSRKCISYLTIEYKGKLPEEMKDSFGSMIFGCDICQDVCPWNRFSLPHEEPHFEPSAMLRGMDREKWQGLTRTEFESIFEASAVKRAGFEGLKRNINFVNGNPPRVISPPRVS